MSVAYINGKRIQLAPRSIIGKGGEADIYDVGSGSVLKLYKRSDDPDYGGNPTAQAGAQQRLAECQTKLPAFPKNLPAQVIAPCDLAYSQASGGEIVGFTMPFLSGME